MINKGFKNDVEVIGTVKASGKIDGEFVYNGPLEDIQKISTGCGVCTNVHKIYEKEGKTIIPFTYTDGNVSNGAAKQKYPGGVINVTKSVTVWFSDNEDFKVLKKDNSGKVLNPKKEHHVLNYRVDVKI